jgi:hypothetical protein
MFISENSNEKRRTDNGQNITLYISEIHSVAFPGG